MAKLYKSPVWLRRKYVHDKLTAAEIGKICGVSEVTITHWLHKFGIMK